LRWILARARRVLSDRQLGQNAVEFGVGVAAVAFVALMGFSALGRAQATYWGAVEPNMAAPTPATADFLHPTSVSTPNCSVSGTPLPAMPAAPTTVILGDTITCTPPTVQDAYKITNEQRAPAGYIGLHVDNSPDFVALCQLGQPVIGVNNNTCTSGLSWTPTDSTLVNNPPRTLSLWYECPPGASSACNPYKPQSNHAAGHSNGVQVNFIPNQTLSAISCGGGTNTVKLGAATVCTATLTPHMPGDKIVWTAGPGSLLGDSAPYTVWPRFTCDTQGNPLNYLHMVFNNPADPACMPNDQLACTTDPNGTCTVVYRRLRDDPGDSMSTALGQKTLRVTASPHPVAPPGYADLTINVTPPTPHQVNVFIECFGAGVVGNTFKAMNPPAILDREWPATTAHIQAVSGQPLTCLANVVDTAPSPATACDAGPPAICNAAPEAMDGHPPLGVITWYWPGGPVNGQRCSLERHDTYGHFQHVGVDDIPPYASWCSTSVIQNVSGTGTGQVITADYDATNPAFPSDPPSHVDNFDQVFVDFQ
jgi:hypothetical protein